MSQGGLSGLGLPKSKQHFPSEVDGETGKQSAATMYFLYDGLRTASGLGFGHKMENRDCPALGLYPELSVL